MSRWEPVEVPYVAERFIAFSVPDGRRFFVVSYAGVHEVVFGPPLLVNSDDACPEGDGVFYGHRIDYQGESRPTLGLYGGTPILVDDSGHVLDLVPPEPAETSENGEVLVLRTDGELVQSLPYVDYSGDWQAATFSTDYRHVVIGTPYTITVYRRV